MNNITWVGFLNGSGYAQACQDYVFALMDNGFDISLRLMHSKIDAATFSAESMKKISSIVDKENNNTISVRHCLPDMQRKIGPTDKTIGFATFETFHPPVSWNEILNKNTAVIVPSKFNEKVFKQSGVKSPIFHIPHCLDERIYNCDVEPLSNYDEFTFLFVGTWKKRKGYEALIEAWCKEFSAKDNVRLVIKTDKILFSTREIENIKNRNGKKEFAPISWEGRRLNEVEMPRLFASADCLISPTLGEGFGLPGLQSMMVGTPVIITDFSGCQDYANEETATLLKPRGFISYPEMDMYPQFANKIWANIEWQEIAEKMRYVLNNQEEVQKKAIVGRKFAVENFGYKITANRFSNLIKSII